MATNETAWLEARITKTEELIVAYEEAIAAVAGGAQSYTIDTGQTRQAVTRHNLTEVRNTLASLENRRATLMARLYGGSTVARPGF